MDVWRFRELDEIGDTEGGQVVNVSVVDTFLCTEALGSSYKKVDVSARGDDDDKQWEE